MTTSGTIEPLYRSSDDHLLLMRGRCGIKERFACIVDLALPNWPPRDLGVVARVQVDVLIAGSDALLMTVAAHTALRRGLGVLLAPEASHLDVSSLAA